MNDSSNNAMQHDLTLLLASLQSLQQGACAPQLPEGGVARLDQLLASIATVIDNVEANRRTAALLAQSQSLACELQQRNQELAEKATQLALSSQYKSEFLANMSHELRTPLNSLLILAQQLADNPEGNLSARQTEFAKTIHGAGSDLLTLINDILDLSKIESGTVTLERSEYRFQSLHHYVERTFRHMAEARQLGFSVHLAPSLPAALMTDSTRLQQVLKNLLSNAFKFTQHGQVALAIALLPGGGGDDYPTLRQADALLAFAVSDTGIGIASDKLQLIFEAFQQADGSTARKYGGTGLGLSISRELARLLGGEIRVTSVLGQGSTFTLLLPYQQAGSGHEAPSLAPLRWDLATPAAASWPAALRRLRDDLPADAGRLAGRQVLIVDDDLRNIFALSSLLERQQMQVWFAENGRDGIAELERNPGIEIVLMDIMMPEMDGYDTMRAIRRLPRFRSLPIITLTAKAMKGDRDKCIAAGASDYITKPVDVGQLLALMRLWLQ